MMSPVLGESWVAEMRWSILFHFEAPGDIGEPDPACLAPPPHRFDRELDGISGMMS